MTGPGDPIDPARCPLCGQANACAMETARLTGRPQPPCWCTGASFAPDLLAAVATGTQPVACVCAACARRESP